MTSAPGARTSSDGTLALNGVTRRFGDFTAVDGISVEVAKGELLALVGASGSGKTTTLRIAAGYEIPDAGSVTLDGTDITHVPPERRGFGMVFQHYALFPHMPVEQNVAFGLEARGIAKGQRLEKARRALDAVGLKGAGGRAIQSLSGGEQQRVALARAMVIEPRALLLDEPLSNLDPSLRQTMRNDLRAMLRRVGVPALFVTHDQEDAFAISDRIALMKQGKLLQCGTAEELYHRPLSREVAAFIGRGSILPAIDRGGTATVTIGSRSSELRVVRPSGAPSRFEHAYVVFRPDSLQLAGNDDSLAWRGRILNRRFAGGAVMYRIELAEDVVVEVASSDETRKEEEIVAVRPIGGPFALVPR